MAEEGLALGDDSPDTPMVIDRATGEVLAAPPPAVLWFGSVLEFFTEYLRWQYSRDIDARSKFWAANWWDFGEGLTRVTALWRAWEALRIDGSTGMSVWFRDHADHHMRALMASDGPFRRCSDPADTNIAASRTLAPLPHIPPPPHSTLWHKEPHLAHVLEGCPD